MESKDKLIDMIKTGAPMTLKQQLRLTVDLSTPAILAQLSIIVMQYIDSSMVGSLGANDSASIGLVSTSIWLFGGLLSAAAMGFTVQVAHLIGANRSDDARSVLRQSLVSCMSFSLALALVGCLISGQLPHWLGGNDSICHNATRYFFVLSLFLPFLEIELLAGGMLRSSGNMKVPGLLNIMMCVLDVVFNFLFIFPTRDITISGHIIHMPGAGLGVMGAALGTVLAEVVTCLIMLYFLLVKSRDLKLKGTKGRFIPTVDCLKKAVKIGSPIGLQQVMMCGAYIATTVIVAPLGSIAIAANAFAVIAEGLCYMPGYGLAEAATTLVGQSTGANRHNLSKRFAHITVTLGVLSMTTLGILMYIFAPQIMSFMSPVKDIVDLGAQCLRIEAWAEPLFGASIVCYGVMVGAGDTLIPSAMNLGSMWIVRITLAALLAPTYGLIGVWIAMCIELWVRGSIFLIRLYSERWIKMKTKNQATYQKTDD
ncbi:MAG: MATE family efflux transporter [Muribaculaceae bacterium]|nr:MATE family efflux transporter [Muribaculaceae bacterium]